jgi:outer membrane biosynthesis protein TonB
MMALSVAVHAAAFFLGSAISPLFPTMRASPPVFVELTNEPVSELPAEPPAPPVPAAPTGSAAVSTRAPAPSRPVPKENPAAQRWLKKLDAGIPKVAEAPIARGEGETGGIPVRHWTGEGPARPGDFAPAVAPERTAAFGKQLEELEARVRRSGRPGVGFGKETEGSVMFGGAGGSTGEPIPAWIREMIRKRVRDHLPELEGIYTEAIRRNPDLRGKLVVRFRIDPSGKILRAESAGEDLRDPAFVNSIIEKIRTWTFEPTGGRAVEILYPFLFVTPS